MKKSLDKFSQFIDENTVHYIANLIRLKITDEDAKVYSQQFSQIIEYFQILSSIDTREVRPANENDALNSIFREDIIQPSMSREEFLKNSPDHDKGYVRAPRVFDER